MDDIVPGALQRLREADIVGMAGLANASLGQEYCRSGYVSNLQRQEARVSGLVTIPDASVESAQAREYENSADESSESGDPLAVASQHFAVSVEVLSGPACRVVCTCDRQTKLVCAHAAALLYQWVLHPYTFTLISPASQPETRPVEVSPVVVAPSEKLPIPIDEPEITSSELPRRYTPLPVRRSSLTPVAEALAQLGLSELRAVAREYGIMVTNLGKQQLIETMLETMAQPEAVRRVVGSLEKPQRQLLAALALAGGTMSDEDLRGLFERFGLENAGTLPEMLVVLQAKLLLVRTSLNRSLQQRLNPALSPLDISWYIPQEILDALHATVPISSFPVNVPYSKNGKLALPVLTLAHPQTLLSDLLLVARVLDHLPGEQRERRGQRVSSLPSTRLASDGSLALSAPEDQPAPALLETLEQALDRSPARLRFLASLLQQARHFARNEGQSQRSLSELLLGPISQDVLHDLFMHWLNHPTYVELFELAESGVRVRCRATPLNQPALRRGELEQENTEARQELVHLLSLVPGGEWVHFSAFARFVYRLHPTFLQHRQRLFPAPHWWIEREEGHQLHPTHLADWLRAEGRYLAHLLQGPLYWWGICDLAHSVTGQLLAFRLTPMAAFFFHGLAPLHSGDPGTQNAQTAPGFHVSADGDILVQALPTNWPLLSCIEAFATSTGVEQEQLRYRLTPFSLSEAMSQGHDPRELITLLKRYAHQDDSAFTTPLLQSLERRIAQYGRVRIYTDVALVQTADSQVMQQLAAITTLEEQTVHAIHPDLLILKRSGVERLLEELKRRGQTPLLHEEV